VPAKSFHSRSAISTVSATLRIEQGKGHKDRYAMLPPVLLERLRVWWRVARAQGKMLDGGWLFPGLNPIEPLSTRQLNRAIHAAAEAAQIDKRVSMHTLRHMSSPKICRAALSWPCNNAQFLTFFRHSFVVDLISKLEYKWTCSAVAEQRCE
jgi:integrase